jgi:opacity protein-like surface antigen
MKLRGVLLTPVVILLALAAFAQGTPPKIEVSVDYSYARFNPAHAFVPNTYSLNGGGGAIDFNFAKYIGLVGEFEGYSSNTQRFTIPPGNLCPTGCSGNVQANLFTYMFGPQIGIRTGKFRPFGHLLFGGAHSNAAGSLYKQIGTTAARPSSNAFAMTFGGGLDIPVNKSGTIAIRPVEIDYLYTYFNISGSGGNSNFRYQAGVVFNF